MSIASARLGELLETRGQITREQLLRALRSQKVLGGRLGTCLLEIEALSEEQLCSALAQQLGVPSATPEELRGIPDEVLALLPSKVARRCRAIAFHATSTQVKVALMDARNLAVQDEISFVIGKRIRWYVAPELRLFEALEKHYGEECPTRFAKLLDRMNRSRFLWARENAATAAREVGERASPDQLLWDTRIAGVAPESSATGDSETAKSTIALELPQFQHQTLDLPASVPIPFSVPAPAQISVPLPVPTPVPPSAPLPDPRPSPPKPEPAPPAGPAVPPMTAASRAAAQPAANPGTALPPAEGDDTQDLHPSPGATHRKLSVQEAEQRLLRPTERDDVARALIDFAAGLVERAVLFVVRKDEIAAWLWTGEGIDAPRLAALRLQMQHASVFAGLKQREPMFRGALAPLPAHLAIAACFAERSLSGNVLVMPVRVKERLVAALYLSPGIASEADLASADLADLQRVVAKAEIAFELCIMQSKLRKA